eukprot:1845878-Prymnesium_polylepis.1
MGGSQGRGGAPFGRRTCAVCDYGTPPIGSGWASVRFGVEARLWRMAGHLIGCLRVLHARVWVDRNTGAAKGRLRGC